MSETATPEVLVEPELAEVKSEVESIDFIIVFGKESTPVSRPADSTVGQLKAAIELKLSLPVTNQKLLCAGKALKDDSMPLKQAGIKKGSKVMLLGSNAAALQAMVPQAPGATDEAKWDTKEPEEPPSKQKQHAKVIEKGVPEEALKGIKDRQIPLPEDCKAIPGLLNSQATKVRLTFKEELQQIWIASATSTQKVPYSSISKIEGFPIVGQEEYSMMALHLGAAGSSKYWLYFVPSQHVASIKIRILGLESLL